MVVSGLAERGVKVRAVDRELPSGGVPVVMTMHRSKGTEFRRVLLFSVSEDSIPYLSRTISSETDRDDALLKERSLLYVAASRARDRLVVTWNSQASPFLNELAS